MLANYDSIVRTVVSVFKNKYRLSNAEADDLESEILFRLVKISNNTAQSYMLDCELAVRTIINNAARNFLRSLIRHRKVLVELQECACTDTDYESLILVHEMLDCLTPQQREAIRYWFGLDGLSPTHDYRKIAKLLGITRTQSKQLLDSAFSHMKLFAAVA
jgi:DNA-directed RNA polymerase specialized sigma24 family protein